MSQVATSIVLTMISISIAVITAVGSYKVLSLGLQHNIQVGILHPYGSTRWSNTYNHSLRNNVVLFNKDGGEG
jgi:hypothetical protein